MPRMRSVSTTMELVSLEVSELYALTSCATLAYVVRVLRMKTLAPP